MKFNYTPFYSFQNYLKIKRTKKLVFLDENIGKTFPTIDSKKHTVFKEIYLKTDTHERKEGNAIFQVVFHSSMNNKSIFDRTTLTIPFFIGLPGFCNKKFMINRNTKTYAGYYEWETIEMAKNYAHSFALSSMKRRSKPFPILYRITDKQTGGIIESGEVL